MSGKKEKMSLEQTDDVPEAVREKISITQPRQLKSRLILLGLLGLGLIILLGIFLPRPSSQSQITTVPTPQVSPGVSPPPSTPQVENVLGHLPYLEASPKELKPITPDGGIRLRKTAAEKFLAMQAAARAQGVILAVISGYRSISEQEYLFFKVKEQRNQNTEKRAEVSAPPGYSEHHTGYAVDIGDGKAPATNLRVNFENTAAFRWLKNNANKYSFTMSFPPDNAQGVNYEPWHWRFEGDIDSLETFYKAKNLQKSGKK